MKDQLKIKDFVIIFFAVIIVSFGICCFLETRVDVEANSPHYNYGNILEGDEVMVTYSKNNDLTLVVWNEIEIPLKHDGFYFYANGDKTSLAGFARTNDKSVGYWTCKDGVIRVYQNKEDIP